MPRRNREADKRRPAEMPRLSGKLRSVSFLEIHNIQEAVRAFMTALGGREEVMNFYPTRERFHDALDGAGFDELMHRAGFRDDFSISLSVIPRGRDVEEYGDMTLLQAVKAEIVIEIRRRLIEAVFTHEPRRHAAELPAGASPEPEVRI